MSRHYTSQQGAFARAMKAARIAYMRQLLKAHPTKSTRQLGKIAGISAASVCRFMAEAGFVPIQQARWCPSEGGTK